MEVHGGPGAGKRHPGMVLFRQVRPALNGIGKSIKANLVVFLNNSARVTRKKSDASRFFPTYLYIKGIRSLQVTKRQLLFSPFSDAPAFSPRG
jgi:hypothetical protein